MAKELSRGAFSRSGNHSELEDILAAQPRLLSVPPDRGVPPDPRVVVMIPCLNEEQTVASTVQSIPRDLPGVGEVRILVIDDGSRDGSAAAAVQAGVDAVVRHKRNLGLGRTFRDGLEAALKMGADIIVNIDADGQYEPEEIPLLLQPILDGKADIVLGDRQVDQVGHMSWGRRWGNRIASWVTRRISGLPLRDSQTGFRALNAEAALRLTLEGGYTYTQEMIVQAAYRGLAVAEVPVTFRRREDGGSRLIRSAGGYAIRSGTIMLRSYRDQNPLRAFSFLGILFFLAGGVAALRVGAHFLRTGSVSPFLPSALFAAAMGIVGIQVLVFGLMADTMRANRRISEDILLYLRRKAWENSKTTSP